MSHFHYFKLFRFFLSTLDTDVIIWEGDPADPTCKPPEMYTLIENFCLGLRRLEIFGRPSSVRRGWVTVMGQGRDLNHLMSAEGVRATKWDRESWDEGIKEVTGGVKPVVPMTSEIDALRPKSPIRAGQSTTAAVGATTPAGVGVAAGGVVPGRMNQNIGLSGINAPQPTGPNQLMMQQMMPMGMQQLPMGMGAGVDEIMASWNPMMGGMAGMAPAGMPGMNIGVGGMGMPMMGNMANMGFQAQGNNFGPAMFNGNMPGVGLPWGDQFGMDGGWDNESGMMGLGMNPLAGGMGMGPGTMGMGQWGPNAPFDNFQ